MSYDFSARGYLARAKKCLKKTDRRYLFYAAFELRCGVESRMQEYLEAWDNIPPKEKNAWELGKLGASTERHFQLRDRYQTWSVLDGNNEVQAVLYYTPVTSALRINAAKLGNYLHAADYQAEGSPWWADFRALLEEIIRQLQTATTGTLLGPSMLVGKMEIRLGTEVPPGFNIKKLMMGEGKLLKVDVTYLDTLPSVLPEKAVIWHQE